VNMDKIIMNSNSKYKWRILNKSMSINRIEEINNILFQVDWFFKYLVNISLNIKKWLT
jgi:hypothetical protein